jgi:hypothetical protein
MKKFPIFPNATPAAKVFSANLSCSRQAVSAFTARTSEERVEGRYGHSSASGGMKEQCARDAKRVVRA